MELLEICGLQAKKGEKVSAMVDVPGTAASQIPVTIIRGEREGKTVLISGGLHSCEYVGAESSMQLARELQPSDVAGSLIICHPLNVSGFRARIEADVAEDRKNLNRIFPGNPNGTTADIIAWVFSQQFQAKADFYIDLHGGEIFDDLIPHVYFNGNGLPENQAISREAAGYVDVPYLYKSVATTGAWNSAAIDQHIPSILIERGCQGKWSQPEVDAMKKDVRAVLQYLKVLEGAPRKIEGQRETAASFWPVLPEIGYPWYPAAKAGDFVKKGQVMGRVKDFFGNVIKTYYFEADGLVMCINSALVIPEHGGVGYYVCLAD